MGARTNVTFVTVFFLLSGGCQTASEIGEAAPTSVVTSSKKPLAVAECIDAEWSNVTASTKKLTQAERITILVPHPETPSVIVVSAAVLPAGAGSEVRYTEGTLWRGVVSGIYSGAIGKCV